MFWVRIACMSPSVPRGSVGCCPDLADHRVWLGGSAVCTGNAAIVSYVKGKIIGLTIDVGRHLIDYYQVLWVMCVLGK